MTRRIILVKDPLSAPSEWEYHDVENYSKFLASKFTALPPTMALYHGSIAPQNNVTPKTAEEVDRFEALDGDVYAVMYPGTGIEIALAIYSVILIAVMIATKPSVPDVASPRNLNASSSNNDLAQRSNKARPNARIPDIFGEVISTPDLLGKTYSIYKDDTEYEYSYMCIGRGAYAVSYVEEKPEIKDDTTYVTDIEGAAVALYGPYTSPNGGVPFLTIGDPINEPVISVTRTEAVNGQVLAPEDPASITAGMKYLYPNKIIAPAATTIDFTTNYTAGDVISMSGSLFLSEAVNDGALTPSGTTTVSVTAAGGLSGFTFLNEFASPVSMVGLKIHLAMDTTVISGQSINLSGTYVVISDDTAGNMALLDVGLVNGTWALLPGGSSSVDMSASVASYLYNEVNLAGTYEIASVTTDTLEFVDAGLVNPNWVYTYNGGSTMPVYPAPGSTTSVTVSLNDVPESWQGPFDVYQSGATGFIINIIARSGLYKDDGTTQFAASVLFEIEITPISSNGAPLGPSKYVRRTITGSAFTTKSVALTVRPTLPLAPSEGYRFRARRITPKDTVFSGNVVDEIQWKDLYLTAPVNKTNFGDVTTIQCVTVANSSALSVKNRKLNLRVTRKLPILSLSGSPPGYALGAASATRDIADILAYICTDPKIGNRPTSEIDFVNLRTVSDQVATYFNRNSSRCFSFTFDDEKTSFEEMVNAVADAGFCTPFRRGNVIQLSFEKAETDARLIFNHRNKLPGTEKRTVTWGIQGNYDGVEYEYIDRKDGSLQTLYLPEDQSAVRAKTIQSIGVMGHTQATLHANRVWNKLRYQRISTEFTATHEAELLQRNMIVMVANNCRPRIQDGEVRAKDGLVITVSQPVKFEPGVDYAIFLQAKDQTVQSISATAGANEYEVTLAEEPAVAMSLDPANYALTTYLLVPESQVEPILFMVNDRTYDSKFSSKVTCVNYDARYYSGDTLYKGRVAKYSGLASDSTLVYDDATELERDDQAFFANDDGTIHNAGDPAYVYASDFDDGES
jgi:hypothetical protein